MNLSYWEKTSFYKDYDFCIVGAGIVGLFAALRIKEKNPSAKVLVLERSFLPEGASTKNAGFACFGSLSEIIEHRQRTSKEEFLNLVTKRIKGLRKLRQTLGDEAIDFEPLGGYEIFTKEEETVYRDCIAQLSEYNNLLSNIIGNEVYSLRDEHIEKFGFKNVEHLIFTPYEGMLHSGKMMEKLLSQTISQGVNIIYGTEVVSSEANNGGVLLKTNNGKISTSKAIFTTNAFIKKLFPALDVNPGRGQVLVTKEIPDLKFKGTFHYQKGFYYFRNVNNRVLLGGGRNLDFTGEATFEFGTTEKIQKELFRILAEVILPETKFEIDYTWSGIMAFGETLNPIVTELEKNSFCAVRCNGMGVAIGSVVGEEVADMAMQTKN